MYKTNNQTKKMWSRVSETHEVLSRDLVSLHLPPAQCSLNHTLLLLPYDSIKINFKLIVFKRLYFHIKKN